MRGYLAVARIPEYLSDNTISKIIVFSGKQPRRADLQTQTPAVPPGKPKQPRTAIASDQKRGSGKAAKVAKSA